LYNCPKLIKVEFAEGMDKSINLSGWNPDSETLAHQDFLPNFRTYIALRLADNGSGKTLTLSQAVFSTIWDANGNPQVLQDGLDQLRADIHNIVKTTKHWDVNKAN
jgi:predicted ATPase